MTDYEKTLHLRLMLVVAKDALTKIAYKPGMGGKGADQIAALNVLSALAEMDKVMKGVKDTAAFHEDECCKHGVCHCGP